MGAWRYAEALSRVGDDASIEALREHLIENSLSPNVRYWIQRVIKTLEKNWRKITKKWPEPWLAWDGSIAQGQGKAYISEDEFIEIEYSIWNQRAAQPTDRHSWVGSMWPIPFGQAKKVQRIELENGTKGRILATEISNEHVVFLGTGSYPR